MGNNLNDFLLIGMLIGWLVYKNSIGKPIAEKTAYNKIIFLYLLFSYFLLWKGSFFLQAPVPFDPGDIRVQHWKNYMILPLLFLLVFNNLKDTKELKRLFTLMVISMFIMSYYTFNQIGSITAWWNRVKIQGTFVWLGVNEVAAFYATYTLVVLGVFFYCKNNLHKIILGILVLVNLYCDLFMYSRGAYMATLAGLFVTGVLKKRILLIPVILIILFWQVVLPKTVIDRINFSEHEGQLDESAEKRLEFWQENIAYFKESPIIGIGYNVIGHIGSGRDTHNLYVRTLAEQGIVGLSFLLGMMILAFKRGLRLFNKADDTFLKGLGLGFCACVIAVLVGNFFGDRWTYLPLGAYFWVFLGMVERGNAISYSEQDIAHSKNKP